MATTTERGYGANHVRLREEWRAKVETGEVDCWRCGRRITSDEPWELGHDDEDRSKYRGPEHFHCNRSAGGAKGAAAAHANRTATIREW